MTSEVETVPFMSCPMCKMDYDKDAYVPYVASCGHNICIQCIPDIVNAICPTCGQPTFHKKDINYLAVELIYQMELARVALEEAKGIWDTQTEEKDLYWRNQGGQGNQPDQNELGTPTSFQSEEPKPPAPQFQTFKNPAAPAPVALETSTENEDIGPESKVVEIFNVPLHWTKPDINEKFGLWGNARIVRSYLPRYQDGRLKGSATVEYEAAISAKEAVFTLNNTDNGRGGLLFVKLKTTQMPLNKAIKKSKHLMVKKFNNKTSIHISNLGHVTEEQLSNHFRKHGTVFAVMLCRDKMGHPTGNANLNYEYDHSVHLAIKHENGTYFPNTTQKMIVDPFHDN